MAPGAHEIYFQVDDAWPAEVGGLPTIDARREARALRFITSPAKIGAFLSQYKPSFRPFTLLVRAIFITSARCGHGSSTSRSFSSPSTIIPTGS